MGVLRIARLALADLLLLAGELVGGHRNPGFGEEPEDEETLPHGAPVTVSEAGQRMVARPEPPAPPEPPEGPLVGSLAWRRQQELGRGL